MTGSILARLRAIVGDEGVKTDADSLQTWGRDWTRFYEPAPLAIVFVRTAAEVQALVLYANEAGLALVPSGGRTGLSGGAVAQHGEVVVSFDRMNKVLAYDAVDGTVRVEAGVITASLQAFAEAQGKYYPVDFASAGSSQVGGNIATNAGGIKVLRYGLTRDWIAGLKVVTGEGRLLDLNRGLVKNATGYDLRHLFIGSEGTLGFIVEATIRLTEPPRALQVALLAVPELEHIIAILDAWRSRLTLTAYEFFSDRALGHVLAHTEGARPFEAAPPFYALLEFDNPASQHDEAAMAAFTACVEAGWAVDGVLSQSDREAQTLWSYRERISESITPFTPYKNDVAVTIGQVPAFLRAVDETVTRRYPEFELIWFGHIGDGNLHLNILKPADWELATFKATCEGVSEEVLAIVADFGGSISAEHGVGLLKRDQLHFSRSADEIAMMTALKRVFDPNGVMNPGKLLPGAG